jgi:ferric-dicitrate binding protein FerR (iron transport regulator)
MAERARLAYQHWKQADAQARNAEQELSRTWELFHARLGPAPSSDLIRQVSRLRAAANAKLSVALGAMSLTGRPVHDDPVRRA